MFGKFRKEKEDPLDTPINAVLHEMDLYGPDTEEFAVRLAYLERLKRIKNDERRDSISYDTLAVVGGNLLGILIIVMYEQKHVMTSKAFGFTLKKNP